MILQALTRHYEDLLALGRIPRPGWTTAKVSYALALDGDGRVIQLLHLNQQVRHGKKTVWVPQELQMPTPAKRTSGVAANFLCDNSSYLLGVDGKGNPAHTANCFSAAKALHLSLLKDAASPVARSIVRFFETWDPARASVHPALQTDWADLMKGGNLVFWYEDASAAADPEIRNVWQRHYGSESDGAEDVLCLVTGRHAPLARLHPSIKGVVGAQSSGASLVCFDKPAFCSYAHKQGNNAPTGEYAAFAYATALNTLLADRNRVCRVGDTTILFWAEGAKSAYQDCLLASMFNDCYTEHDILAALHSLANGNSVDWDGARLDPDTRFYVLGLTPNTARLSVRFFWQNSFGVMMRNLQKHYERLNIVRPAYDPYPLLPVWRMVRETIRNPLPGARPQEPNPRLAGDLLLAILNDNPYPATLLDSVVLRIRAERNVTRGQAAILKAYYLRNSQDEKYKEVLTVDLNAQSNYLPYVLGRLFAVLEFLQRDANGGNAPAATIKDKYFNSASATPATVFPLLINLAQKHLSKLGGGPRIKYDKDIAELNSRITQTLPARMSLQEQGAFQLGYYHETQKRYTKKEEN